MTHFGSRASPQIYFHRSPEVFQLLSLDRYTAASCCLGLGMLRRKFITLIGGAVAGWSLPTRAQQNDMRVIGFLNAGSAQGYAPSLAAFLKGLGEAGYVDGRNMTIQYRWAE